MSWERGSQAEIDQQSNIIQLLIGGSIVSDSRWCDGMVWVLRLTGFSWLCEKMKEHQTLPVECLPRPSPKNYQRGCLS